jgi:hypothetical protein
MIDSCRAANAAPAAWWCWVTFGEQSRVISRERRSRDGFGYSQVVNCDKNGKVEGVVDLPRLNGPQYPSCVGIIRPALHQILANALSEAGVAVHFGLTVNSIRQSLQGPANCCEQEATRRKIDAREPLRLTLSPAQ